nr:T9SS type B sorting domain-containing protein [uncultured Capnocytophaga sp.]
MKKFLIAIVLFVVGLSVSAQECFDVQLTPTAGQCKSDAKLRVTAQPKSPMPAGCTSSGNYSVELTKPSGSPSLQALSGTPASYEFADLQPGVYTVTVYDNNAVGVKPIVRTVTITTTYKTMNITAEGIAPTCAGVIDGQIQFKIPSGGTGPFEVTVTDESGNILIPMQTFNRPSPATKFITIQGGPGKELRTGNVVLVVHDKTNISNVCGETQYVPVEIKEPEDPSCFEIQMYQTRFSMGANCKFKLYFIIRKKDGGYVFAEPYRAAANNYFKGKAKVEILNRVQPVATPRFVDENFYVDDYIFQKGDQIRITVNGGKNTIVQTVELDNGIDIPQCPSDPRYQIGLYHNDASTYQCGTASYTLYMYFQYADRQVKDVINGGTRRIQVKYNNEQVKPTFIVEKETSPGVWSTITPAWHTFAADNNSARVNLPSSGKYRIRYQHPNGCSELCRTVELTPPASIDPAQAFRNIRYAYGVYENTGAFYRYIYRRNKEVIFPITVKLTPTDGRSAISFQTRLPFETATYTKTVVFPLVQTWNDEHYYGWGDLPAGTYSLSITDACGNIATTTVQIALLRKITDSIKVETTCNSGKVTYDLGEMYGSTPKVYLTRETFPGNYVDIDTKTPKGYSQQPVGSFSNLFPGNYALKYRNLYYQATDNSPVHWQVETALPTAAGKYPHSQIYYHPFTVKPQPSLDPVLSASACSASSGSGIISVDLTGQQISYPLTFTLFKKPNLTTPVRTITFQATDPNNTYAVFNNLDDGSYMVRTTHACQSVQNDIEVKINTAFTPNVVITAVANCRGDQAKLYFSLSDFLFDIRWYQLNAAGQRTTSTPLGTQRTFSRAISETTTFEVEYQLKSNIGCGGSTTPMTKTVTVSLPKDTTPPVISGCPSNITVIADAGKCSKKVSWIEPTATDTCFDTTRTTRSHTPNTEFGIGTHTVVYTFSDIYGNTSTCTFKVIVKSRALEMTVNARYTNSAGVAVTQLNPNDEFIYEISYQNTGQNAISTASLTVKLPANARVITNGNPILTGATQGGIAPGQSYDPITKTYLFNIPGTTIPLGGATKVIKIPMKHIGGCAEASKPCGNYFTMSYQMNYGSITPGCNIAPQAKEGTHSMTINTAGCSRQEVFCVGSTLNLTAEQGFDTYKWFVSGTLQPTYTTYQYTGAGTAGTYRVEKTKICDGVQITSEEVINFQTATTATDPIRSQANNVGVTCADNNTWTSHFYLCDGKSKTISVNYVNTTFQWQQWNGSCTESSSDCRNSDDQCWTPLHSNSIFQLNTSGKYRLKVQSGSCANFFYFEAFTAGLGGTVTDVIHQTDFTQGSVKISMNTNGINYNIQIFDASDTRVKNITTSNSETLVDGLSQGTYTVKVTSPQVVGCELNDSFEIKKLNKMTMTATFKGFKQCNTATFELKAEGGEAPYHFFLWSIDGVQQHANESAALNSTPIATQSVSESSKTIDVPNITQVGEYVFLVGDARNGAFALSNKVTVTPPNPHNFTVSATTEIACATQSNTGIINTIFGVPNQKRKVTLYTLDANGNRLPNPRTSVGGLFTGLTAGTYEIFIEAKVGVTTCTYSKKPIVILPTQKPLQGFATILADKSCDTNNPKQYKVAVANISGGTTPYRYSFDGGATFGSTAIGYMGASGNIFVEDSKGCRISLPIKVAPDVIPSVGISSITYRCDSGNGVVTLTVSATASQTYEYSIDGETPQSMSGTTVVRELTPGVHSLTIYYKTVVTDTTTNVLFREDFGTGNNGCLSDATTAFTCAATGTLSDGNYILTKAVTLQSGWVTTPPADASGGRYMAIAGSGGNEKVYEKRLNGIEPNKPLSVSLDAMSLIPTAGIAPRFNIEVRKSDGSLLLSRYAGTATNGVGWTSLKADFLATEITGFSDNQLIIRIVNIAVNTYNNLGNDYVIDNITVFQQPKICDNSITQLINIEANKQMRVEKYEAEKNVSCYGNHDGAVAIRVVNPVSNQVKYTTDPYQTTWTTTTLNAQGVFTITGLSATQNGVLTVQDATQNTCVVSLAGGYKIGEPGVITPTVIVTDKATCFNNQKAKVRVSATGGTPNYRFQVGLVTGTLSAMSAPSINPIEFSNLSPGTYSLVVTDNNNCTTQTTFEIVAPDTISATAEPASYCYQFSDAKYVVINILSGNGNYKVQKQGSTSIYAFSSGSFTYPEEVASGTHTFMITDGYGCTTSVTTKVFEALSLQVSPTYQQYANCKGNLVTYTLTAKGGDPAAIKEFRVSTDSGATYSTIGSATSQVEYGANATTHTDFKFQVRYYPDGSECKAEQYITLRSDPPRLLVGTLTVTAATCGRANGALLLSPSDYHVGTSSHTVQVLDASNAVQTMTALAPGVYTLKITDDRGCEFTQNFTVNGVPQLTATVTVTKQISCNSPTADLAVKLITGGKAPYTVKVENTTHNTTQSATHNSQAANTTLPFTGLNYGNYNITIVDANGCETHLQTVVNANTTSITVRYDTPTNCSTTHNAYVKAASTASFTTTANAYFAVYRTGIQNPIAPWITPKVVPNSTGGSDTWYKGNPVTGGVEANIPNLTSGVRYTFVVYNADTGCRYTHEATIPVPTLSTLAVTLSQTPTTSCAEGNDGKVNYTLSGWQAGSTISWKIFNNSTHQQVDTGTAAAVTTPQTAGSALAAGHYYIVFTESPSNCTQVLHFEVKKSHLQMQISATATQKASCNTQGEAWLNITGGTATYTYGYVASGTAYTSSVMTRTLQASDYIKLPAGNWDVYVLDAYGCLQSTTVTIDIFDTPNIVTVTTLACQAYNNLNGKVPVKVTLDKIGQGAHYYSLDGSAEKVIAWTIANQAFEVEVDPIITHTITVKDVNGCVTTATFSTTAIITASATLSKLKTCASPTAAISVTVAGGTGTYSYTLEHIDNGSSAGQIIAQNQALSAGTTTITIPAPADEGTYRITIYDAETINCPIVKEVILPVPIWPNIDDLVVQPYHEKCNLGLTATGTGVIEVAMPTDSDSYTFRILSATDRTTGLAVPFTPTPSSAGTHNATFTQLHGTPIGVLYVLQLTVNSTGCTANFTAEITSPEPLELQTGVISATQYVCEGNKGLSTPRVSVDTSKIRGGIPPYTIEFFDNGGNSLGNGTEYTLSNLNGGTFYAMIKDASGTCATSTTSVTVEPAFELQTLSITTTTSATCAVDEVINISVTATPTYIAGTPLRYEIKGNDNAFTTITTTTATNLSLTLTGSQNLSGSNYKVEVFNEKTGCSITGVHTVKDANTFEITSSNPVRAICHNGNGSIMLTFVDKDLSNGDQSTTGFTYTVTAVSGGATIPGSIPVGGNTRTLTLVGGSYDIEAISNATGCKVAKHRFVIPSNPSEIKVINVSQKVSVDCGNHNGVVALTVIGGEQTYTVTLAPLGGGTPKVQPNVPEGYPGIEIAGLDAGTYNITVEDALGCTTATGTLSVTLAPYSAINTASITVATTSITCIDAKDGTLKVSGVTGGVRPYHFILFKGSTKSDEISGVNGDEVTFSNIEPGTYHIDILDAQNCSVTLAGSYSFVNPTAITADINALNSKFVTCKGTRDGKVEIVNITGGTGTYTISIARADTKQNVKTHRDVTSSTDLFDELGVLEGTYYEVVIKDSNDCTMTKTLSFTVEELPDVTIKELKYYGTCQASSNSYVDYLEVHFNNPSPDYSKITYSLNGAPAATFTRTTGNVAYIDNFNRSSVTQTVEVTYTIVSSIPGMTGSCSASETITIDPYTPLTVTRVTTNTTLNTLEVLARGGRTNNFRGYTYYFNEVSKGDNPVYKINHDDPDKLVNGRRYKVVNVRVEDAEGCTVTATYDLEYFDIEVPNFFTPNGDGENDVWKAKYLDNNVNARIYIFDRYGRRLVKLEPGEGWDGTYEKQAMPSGDYWYIIEINDQLYDKREFYGNFTLFR